MRSELCTKSALDCEQCKRCVNRIVYYQPGDKQNEKKLLRFIDKLDMKHQPMIREAKQHFDRVLKKI